MSSAQCTAIKCCSPSPGSHIVPLSAWHTNSSLLISLLKDSPGLERHIKITKDAFGLPNVFCQSKMKKKKKKKIFYTLKGELKAW